MLTPLQERVARIVSSLPESEGFAPAGGAALVVVGVGGSPDPGSRLLRASPEGVQRLLEAVDTALAEAGLTVDRERVSPGFARLTVTGDDDATDVDLAADARMRPVELGPLGPMLSLEELAADKLLALFDRAQARDFVDVAVQVERFGFERLCELAKEKDAGFSLAVLRDMLGGFARFDQAEFGLDDTAYRTLADQVGRWRATLSLSRQRSVDPTTDGPGLGH